MSDIVDHPEEYFGRFVPDRDPLLIDLETEARREEIPICAGPRNRGQTDSGTGYSNRILGHIPCPSLPESKWNSADTGK